MVVDKDELIKKVDYENSFELEKDFPEFFEDGHLNFKKFISIANSNDYELNDKYEFVWISNTDLKKLIILNNWGNKLEEILDLPFIIEKEKEEIINDKSRLDTLNERKKIKIYCNINYFENYY